MGQDRRPEVMIRIHLRNYYGFPQKNLQLLTLFFENYFCEKRWKSIDGLFVEFRDALSLEISSSLLGLKKKKKGGA